MRIRFFIALFLVCAVQNSYTATWVRFNTLIESAFGTENLTPENEAYIRSIEKKMKMESRGVVLKKMNVRALNKWGWHNAVAIFGHIFISESYFNQLSQDAKTYLIGHELIHIDEKHSLIMTIINGMGLIGAGVYYTYAKNAQQPWWKKATIGVSSWLLYRLGIAHIQRECERRADIKSVALLNSAGGGIELLRQRSLLVPTVASRWSVVRQAFSTHPSNEERIAYLEKIQKAQEKSTTQSTTL